MNERKIAEEYKKEYEGKGFFVEVKEVNLNILNQLLADSVKATKIEDRFEWYEDPDDPYEPTWIDVEGHGYGWLWLNRPEDDWKRMMEEIVENYVTYKREEDKGIVLIAMNKHKNTRTYRFFERTQNNWDRLFVLDFPMKKKIRLFVLDFPMKKKILNDLA